jgi:putative endopeptidase
MSEDTPIIIEQMNTCNDSVSRPQDNLYLHVNQRWMDDPLNSIPSDYSRWGGFIKLHDDSIKDQIRLIDSIKAKNDKNHDESKIVAIWDASEKRFQSWKDSTATCLPIHMEIEILDIYLSPNTLKNDVDDYATRFAKYLHYTQTNGISNVFDFNKGSDLTESNNIVLDFSVDGLSLPSRDYYIDKKFEDKLQMFKCHLQNVQKLVDPESKLLGSMFVDNVMQFENSLAIIKMKKEQSRRYDEYFTNTTLTNLYEKIDELNYLKEKMNNYSQDQKEFYLTDTEKHGIKVFLEVFYDRFNIRQILSDNLKKNFTDKNRSNPPLYDHITAYDGDAIRRMFRIVLDQNNFKQYRSYLQYKIICTFKGLCTRDLDEEFFDFYNRKLSGQFKQKSDDKRSVALVNFFAGDMMGKAYVSQFFTENKREDVQNLITIVTRVMNRSIVNNDWMSNETKQRALLKLKNFTSKIGYPDVWKDYSDLDIVLGDDLYSITKKARVWGIKVDFFDKLNSVVDRNEWMMTPQTVNAYYMPTLNEIVFPAAIIQKPFYFETATDIDFDMSTELKSLDNVPKELIRTAANCGGIIAVIAHEISHGFDDQGRKFDENGNLNDWWTYLDVEHFKKKTELINEQAIKYTYTDPKTNHLHRMKPELTTGENLADIGGISLGLQVLQEVVKEYGSINQSELNTLFRVVFKSYANIWRQNITSDHRMNLLSVDPHSPHDFRANLVNNMNEFYNAFDVTEKDKMYIDPSKRLRMW